jgi:hypothetical protein
LTERARPIVDVHHEDILLRGHPSAGTLEGLPGLAGVLDQDMTDTLAADDKTADSFDVDPGFAKSFSGRRHGPNLLLEFDGQIFQMMCHHPPPLEYAPVECPLLAAIIAPASPGSQLELRIHNTRAGS